MDDQRVIHIETDESVAPNDHDEEACSRSSMADDEQESVIVDCNKKAKGVLEGNAVDEKESKNEMVCRICHLSCDQSPERFGGTSDGGKMKETSLIRLGCGCRDELGVAHSHCAETWFKLKGNRICEICGEAARNIKGIIQEAMMVEWNNRRSDGGSESYYAESNDGWWRRQSCCNFLMACLIVAFVLPWFLRVKIV